MAQNCGTKATTDLARFVFQSVICCCFFEHKIHNMHMHMHIDIIMRFMYVFWFTYFFTLVLLVYFFFTCMCIIHSYIIHGSIYMAINALIYSYTCLLVCFQCIDSCIYFFSAFMIHDYYEYDA